MTKIKKIKKILAQHRQNLKEKFQVKEIGVFGSYIKGEENRKSDLDILVEFTEEPGLFDFIELEDYLSQKTGVKVDLVMKSALKPMIGRHILNEVVYL